jgi:hypothetical protein
VTAQIEPVEDLLHLELVHRVDFALFGRHASDPVQITETPEVTSSADSQA